MIMIIIIKLKDKLKMPKKIEEPKYYKQKPWSGPTMTDFQVLVYKDRIICLCSLC